MRKLTCLLPFAMTLERFLGVLINFEMNFKLECDILLAETFFGQLYSVKEHERL